MNAAQKNEKNNERQNEDEGRMMVIELFLETKDVIL